MRRKLMAWVRAQNPYLWIVGAGLFGLIDALIPGPADTRLLGGIVVATGVLVWIWT